MNHKWVLSRSSDRFRTFVCESCGAGPVMKDVLNSKVSINAAAKRQGLSSDCNVELVKQVIEE